MSKTGGCLCGQVRYEATTAPLMSGVCHCKNCQKQAGTAFSTLAAFQKSDVDFVGELALYQDSDTDTGVHPTVVYLNQFIYSIFRFFHDFIHQGHVIFTQH